MAWKLINNFSLNSLTSYQPLDYTSCVPSATCGFVIRSLKYYMEGHHYLVSLHCFPFVEKPEAWNAAMSDNTT